MDSPVISPTTEVIRKLEELEFADKYTKDKKMEKIRDFIASPQFNEPRNDGLDTLIIFIRKGQYESKHFFDCIKLLVDNNIDINYKDDEGRTALSWAKEIYIKEQIRRLGLVEVDEDNKNKSRLINESNKRLKQLKMTIELLEGKVKILDPQSILSSDWFKRLENCQKEGNIDYISGINKYETKYENGNKFNPIEECFKEKWLIPIAYILDTECTNGKVAVLGKENENKEILLKLTLREDEKICEFLCGILRKFQLKSHSYMDCYRKIMDIIKNKNQQNLYSILNGKDYLGRTPLFYAIRYADAETMLELLGSGASLGSTNGSGKMLIEIIKPSILEKHLDSCVRERLEYKPDKRAKETVYHIDCRSIIPPPTQINGCCGAGGWKSINHWYKYWNNTNANQSANSEEIQSSLSNGISNTTASVIQYQSASSQVSIRVNETEIHNEQINTNQNTTGGDNSQLSNDLPNTIGPNTQGHVNINTQNEKDPFLPNNNTNKESSTHNRDNVNSERSSNDTQNNNEKENTENDKCNKYIVFESDVIYYISTIASLKDLMKHPVISTFLLQKRKSLRSTFWMYFLFYILFLISLIMFACIDNLKFMEKKTVICIGIIILIITFIRKIIEIIVTKRSYFLLENCIELLFIISMIIGMSLYDNKLRDFQKQLSAIAFLLAAFEFMIMLGIFPSCSTNMAMLRTVLINYVKFLTWYSALLLGFAFSFYTVFQCENMSFINFFESIFKTIVMTTGEFDSESLNFGDNTTTKCINKIIFILFIFMIPIVLLNLLNGLAFNDIQNITKDAEITANITLAKNVKLMEKLVEQIGLVKYSRLFKRGAIFKYKLTESENSKFKNEFDSILDKNDKGN